MPVEISGYAIVSDDDKIAGAEAGLLPAFENQHNQCAGLNLFEWLAFNRNPHHYRL